jgi:predicted Zn-dependent protease with MMP-like domain
MDHVAPTLDEIEELARETVANLPPAFREDAQKVALRIADFAPDEILEEMEMEPFDLTGLYDGVP